MTDETPLQQEPAASQRPWRTGAWLGGGLVIAAGMWVCVWARVSGRDSAAALPLAAVGMGVVYLVLLALRPRRASRLVWLAVIVLAVLMRAPWFLVPPKGGDDYCRYLWDGAVTASGINPYRHAPQTVLDGRVDDATMQRLAGSGRSTLEGVNHPELRTIYPPAAEGAFALAYWIAPFDLTAWRIVLSAFDVLAALAVLGILRAAALPSSLAFVYLWNPLLVAESYGGGHVDLLAAAMLAMFAWALVTRRPLLAAAVLAIAVGVKLWPVLLLPFLLRPLWGKWRRLAASAAVFVALLALMGAAFAEAFGRASDSGLLTYSRIWSGQSGIFPGFHHLGWRLHSEWSLRMDGHYVARALMMAVLVPILLWLGLRRADDAVTLCRRMALVVVFMLLLGPVLWPWYYVALLPLAAVASPRFGLLLWTASLPLCYLGGTHLSPAQMTWLIHVPVCVVLAAEWAWPHLARRPGGRGVHA
jgi:hypothetical protein